ncbi:hypothetical protein [Thiobacillus sp. 65-1402]|uniref:hypothetical protein n=1 Tax=Thiobacillus sp. 65-1402 TaxID=1895861 RepID=UPI0025E4A5AE|nr:hypothetical protein [Thiobacillus sp. 65-1402]
MKNTLTAVLIAATLSGCATTADPQRQAVLNEINRTIPTCAGADDCNVKWEAAQLWVVHNARYKIQTATNVLIETYNPADSSPYLAARVTKEPLGGGKYRMLVTVWCDNWIGCIPDQYEKALDFNRTVAAAKP